MERASLLAAATQVRVTEMPEIKGGPVRVSTSTATDQPKLSSTVIRKPIGSTQVEVPVISSITAASHDEISSQQRRLHVPVEAPAPGSVSIVLELPPDVPAITNGSFGPSATSTPPLVASTIPNSGSAKETVSELLPISHGSAEAQLETQANL
jgi:hypothetical protein